MKDIAVAALIFVLALWNAAQAWQIIDLKKARIEQARFNRTVAECFREVTGAIKSQVKFNETAVGRFKE